MHWYGRARKGMEGIWRCATTRQRGKPSGTVCRSVSQSGIAGQHGSSSCRSLRNWCRPVTQRIPSVCTGEGHRISGARVRQPGDWRRQPREAYLGSVDAAAFELGKWTEWAGGLRVQTQGSSGYGCIKRCKLWLDGRDRRKCGEWKGCGRASEGMC